MSEIWIDALVVTVAVSVVPLIAAATCGTAAAVLQTVTQVQEQTVGYVIRVGSALAILWFTAPWWHDRMLRLGEECLTYPLAVRISAPSHDRAPHAP